MDREAGDFGSNNDTSGTSIFVLQNLCLINDGTTRLSARGGAVGVQHKLI